MQCRVYNSVNELKVSLRLLIENKSSVNSLLYVKKKVDVDVICVILIKTMNVHDIAESGIKIAKFFYIVWTCSLSCFILVPEEKPCVMVKMSGLSLPDRSTQMWAPISLSRRKTFQFSANRLLLSNRTNREALRLCLWFRFEEGAFPLRNCRKRQCRFFFHHLVITASVYAAILFCYANISFQTYCNHGEMRAYDGGAVTLHLCQKPNILCNYTPHKFHIIPTCESSSSLKGWMSFITRITFTPSDIVFSNCVDLFTFKGQPLPRLNSTWQRIVRRGQPNACISPASKRSKLIYPINEEWGLMLMRDDNLTGQLFFIALLLLWWTNRWRQ